ncbi:YggT family protein [Curtobacterium sp. RRHDQ10]|uniref:YggT family protein n=1 Tax=Curtobacterium phyllosphaerae TaxID=3413379 RepID=UPI003BEF5A5D
MSAVVSILYYLVLLYFFVMWARFVLDLVRNFNQRWRPTGAVLVGAEFVFAVTDPPIRAVRRVLPPLRMGVVALDFGWSIVMLVVIIVMSILGAIR